MYRSVFIGLISILLTGNLNSTTAQQGTRSPIPDDLPVITPANAHQITELYRIGQGWNTTLAWSPDGQTLAIGGSIGIWLYDLQFIDHPRYLTTDYVIDDLVFSPTSEFLISAGDAELVQWDVTSGTPLQTKSVTQETTASGNLRFSVHDIDISADGSLVAATVTSPLSSEPGMVLLWDLETNNEFQLTISVESYIPDKSVNYQYYPQPMELALHPYRNLLAVATSTGKLQFWDISTQLNILEIDLPYNGQLAFSPDGRQLSSTFLNPNDHNTRVTPISEDLELVLYPSFQPFATINFSLDGQYVVTSSRYKHLAAVQAFDTETYQQILNWTSWKSHAAVFSPDGHQIAILDGSATIRIQSIDSHEDVLILKHNYPIYAVDLSPDDNLIAYSQGSTFRVLEISTGTHVFGSSDPDQGEFITDLAFATDPSYVGIFYASSHTINVRNIITGENMSSNEFEAGEEVIIWNESSQSIDGNRIVDSRFTLDDQFEIYVSDTITEGEIIFESLFSPLALAITPDGSTVAIDEHFYVDLWNIDADTHSTIDLREHPTFGYRRILLFSPNGQLLISSIRSSTSGRLDLWDVASGYLLASFDANVEIDDIAFSRDGTFFVTAGGDGTVRLWGVQ